MSGLQRNQWESLIDAKLADLLVFLEKIEIERVGSANLLDEQERETVRELYGYVSARLGRRLTEQAVKDAKAMPLEEEQG